MSASSTSAPAAPTAPSTSSSSSSFPDMLSLRKLNVDPSSVRDKHKQKSLKADMKKATIFAKRMKTFLNEKDLATINKDLDTFSLGMFATEAAQHTAAGLSVDGESKLKTGDTFLLVEAISNIHQRYEKFQPELETKMDEVAKPVLESSFKEMKEAFSFQQQQQQGAAASSSSSAGAVSSSDPQSELSPSQIALIQSQERARVFVKTCSELIAVSVLPPSILVDNVLTPMADLLAKSPKFHHTSQSLALLNIIMKNCGIELTGGKIPGHPSIPTEMAKARIDAAKIRATEKYAPDVGTPSNSQKIFDLVKNLLSSSSGLCGKLKTAVEKQWKALCEKRELQGEDSAAMQQFKKVKDEVENLMNLTEQIAKTIGDEENIVKPLDLTVQQKSSDGAGVVISSRMGDFFSVKDAEQQSRFDDDEQAQFYEGAPLVDHLVPLDQINNPSLLTDEMMKEEEEPSIPEALWPQYDEIDQHIESLQFNCVATSYTDAWTTKFLKLAAKLFQRTAFASPEALDEEDENEKNLKGVSSNDSSEKNNTNETGEETTKKPQQQKTPTHIAKTFYQNCRRRLMLELRYVRGNALEMIPFYARVVAALSRVFKDVGEWLTMKFENDSLYTVDKSVQNSYTRRMRNARFLAELTKFRVAPPGRVLRVMTKLVDELDKETVNVEVLASLFENVGPFLARGGVTAEKLSKIVADTKNKMTIVTNLPEHLIDRMNDSIGKITRANKPRAAAVPVKIKIRSPLEEYMRHLLFKELEPHRSGFVFDQLLKFPWMVNNSPNLKPEVRKEQLANYKMMITTLRDASSCRWDRLYLLARITAKLSQFHKHVGLNVLDLLLEDIRTDLEYPSYRPQQQRLQDLKFLGELFVMKVVPTVVLLYVLGQIVLYFPHQHDEKLTPEKVNNSDFVNRSRYTQQFRYDYSRIRMAVTLLEASQLHEFCDEGRSISPKILHVTKKILLHFFLLIHQKELPLPHDVDFKLAELLENLKRVLNRPFKKENTPSFLMQSFFELSFPPTLAEAEKLVSEKGKWNNRDGFENLFTRLQKISNVSAKSNSGFISNSLCTFANVPTSFARPWQAPVIDGVFDDEDDGGATSGRMLEEAYAAATAMSSNSSGNNNNNNQQQQNTSSSPVIISKDARAAGDFDDDDDHDQDDDASSVSSVSSASSSSSSSSSEEAEEEERGTFSRAGGYWAKQAAARRAKQQQQRTSGNKQQDDSGMLDSDRAAGSFDDIDQENALDDMLFQIVADSTKEKNKTNLHQRDRQVEEIFGRVKGATTKQKIQQNTTSENSTSNNQQQQLMNKMLSGFGNNNNNNNNNTNTDSKKSELASRRLVEEFEKEQRKSAVESSSSSSSKKNSNIDKSSASATSSTPPKPAMKGFALLRRSDNAGKNIEAKTIFLPGSSDIVQATVAAHEKSIKEKQELVASTIRLAKDSETSVEAGMSLKASKKLRSDNRQKKVGGTSIGGGASTTTNQESSSTTTSSNTTQNVSRHQQLQGRTGAAKKSEDDESSSAFKISMRQQRK